MNSRRQGRDDGESAWPQNLREPQTEAEEAKAFEELLGEPLRSWDARIEPREPHLLELEELVTRHREAARQKLWQELLRLWLVGVLVIGAMIFLFQWNVIAFAILQAVTVAGAVLFLFLSRKNREAKRKWTA